MNELSIEGTDREAVRQWIHGLVLCKTVIQYWTDIKVKNTCLENLYKIIKIIASSPVNFVLSSQYIQLFHPRYVFMRIQRVAPLIGEIQVELAKNFEIHHSIYFHAPLIFNSLSGYTTYTKFKGDKFLEQVFPRIEIIKSIIAKILIAAEMKGGFYPVIFLLKATLRKVYIKTKVAFLLDLEKEILFQNTIESCQKRAFQLSKEI